MTTHQLRKNEEYGLVELLANEGAYIVRQDGKEFARFPYVRHSEMCAAFEAAEAAYRAAIRLLAQSCKGRRFATAKLIREGNAARERFVFSLGQAG